MSATRRLAAILAADVRRSASGETRVNGDISGTAARHPEPTPGAIRSSTIDTRVRGPPIDRSGSKIFLANMVLLPPLLLSDS
jgi:hypothetical protein